MKANGHIPVQILVLSNWVAYLSTNVAVSTEQFKLKCVCSEQQSYRSATRGQECSRLLSH